MELAQLAEVELRYRSLQALDYGAGGQLYGTMDGTVSGDRLNGELALTNLAPRRPDGVNMPTLRGLLHTVDDAQVWVECDGLATLRHADQARVFITSVRFRTGDQRYAWMNTIFCVLEGVLDSVAVGGLARGRLHECRPTVT